MDLWERGDRGRVRRSTLEALALHALLLWLVAGTPAVKRSIAARWIAVELEPTTASPASTRSTPAPARESVRPQRHAGIARANAEAVGSNTAPEPEPVVDVGASETPGPSVSEELGVAFGTPRIGTPAARAGVGTPTGSNAPSTNLGDVAISSLLGRWTRDEWAMRGGGLGAAYSERPQGIASFGPGSEHAIGGAFRGDVCPVPPGTRRLVDVERCHPIGRVWFDELGTITRDRWFSLAPDQWTAIVITGGFNVTQAGRHDFSLFSRDGSMLWIDGQLVVDNDGTHCPRTMSGSTLLAAGRHRVRVMHFQSTRNLRCPIRSNVRGCPTDTSLQECHQEQSGQGTWMTVCTYPTAACHGIQLVVSVAPPSRPGQPLRTEI